MGSLIKFLKGNKLARKNYKYAASKAFLDEDGKPIEWEFRPIDTKTQTSITAEAMSSKGEINSYKLMTKVIAAATVYPNLNDEELQDSYGVMSAEELVPMLLDDPEEFANLYMHINKMNGLRVNINDKIEEVKN